MKNKYVVTGIQNDVAAVRQVGRDLTGFVDGAKYLTVGETVELSEREVTFEGQLSEYQVISDRYNAVNTQPTVALWDNCRYVVTLTTGDQWTSDEGNVWHDQNHVSVNTLEFVATQIHFKGGPRDGQSVS